MLSPHCKPSHFGWTLTLFLLCMVLQGRTQSLTAEMRSEDARLTKRVTLSRSTIPLAELCALLQKQTGVTLEMDERDVSSGIEVTLSLHNQTLADTMEALWSLVSCQGATWRWERDKEKGTFRYRLVQSLAAKELPQRLQEEAQKAFEDHTRLVLALTKQSPEERKRQADALAASLHHPDKQIAEAWLNIEQVWKMLSIFARLPAQDQADVLQNKRQVILSFDQLTPDERELIAPMVAGFKGQITRNGVTTPLPPPDRLVCWLQPGKKGDELTASLMIGFVGAGSISYISGYALDWGIAYQLRLRWQIPPHDKAQDAQEQAQYKWEKPTNLSNLPDSVSPSPVTSLPSGPSPSQPKPVEKLRQHLLQIAESIPVSFIACLPSTLNAVPDFPLQGTVQDLLQKLVAKDTYGVMHKWRQGVLLLNYPRWFVEQGEALPYALLKRLRRPGVKNDFFTLKELVAFGSALTEEQWQSYLTPYFQTAEGMRAVFALGRQYSELLAPQGLALNADTRPVLSKTSRLSEFVHPVQGQADAIRLIQRPEKFGSNKVLQTIVQVRMGGRWQVATACTQIKSPSMETQ